MITFLVKRCLEKRRADLQIVGHDVAKLEKIEAPFPRIMYDEAVERLQAGFAKGELENKFEWGGDLGSPDETLSVAIERPLMIHRYPAKVKAFYMEPDRSAPILRSVSTCSPQATAKLSRRLAAHGIIRTLAAAYSRARLARRGVQVVSGFA